MTSQELHADCVELARQMELRIEKRLGQFVVRYGRSDASVFKEVGEMRIWLLKQKLLGTIEPYVQHNLGRPEVTQMQRDYVKARRAKLAKQQRRSTI